MGPPRSCDWGFELLLSVFDQVQLCQQLEVRQKFMPDCCNGQSTELYPSFSSRLCSSAAFSAGSFQTNCFVLVVTDGVIL